MSARESQLFAADGQDMANQPMGTRGRNGRYKMPLLPGEKGTKDGGDWVPGGLQSMTNLAGSISDTRALGIWELEQVLIGVGLSPELGGELRNLISASQWEGVDFQNVRAHPALKSALTSLAEKAKDVSGANKPRDDGIARHDAWQVYGESGSQVFAGSDAINAEIAALQKLLDAAGLELVPELCERVVRNTDIEAGGRFDNVVMCRKTGRLLIADLKTKRKPFWGFLEIDGQLAGYASADYMLSVDGLRYESGPRFHVDQTEGVVLHMPSDGAEPRLRRADLVAGLETMRLARRVCTQRSYGKSAARLKESWWPVD